MILVQGGEFLYGFERQMIYMASFLIDTYPVTNIEYAHFIEATGHRAPFLDEPWAEPYCWKNGTWREGRAKHPVVLVSYDDALAYAQWAGKRLPTAEEWEKAARGTDGREYPWGSEFIQANCNTRESNLGITSNVDAFEGSISPYGCFDMAGNVWEWTSMLESPGRFVIKGGSFTRNCFAAQCAYKSAVPSPHRGIDVGFRCVKNCS